MAAAELAFVTKALRAFVKSAANFDVVYSTRGGSSAPSSLVPPARPRSQVHTLVVLDSSFNPPTVAHMQMATSAIQDLRRRHQQSPHPVAMRLLLLLSVNNADKAPKPAPFEQRLALMVAMAKDLHKILSSEQQQQQQQQAEAQSTSAAPSARLELPIDIGLTSEPYFHKKSNAIAESPFYARKAFPSAPESRTEPDQVFLVGYDTLIRIFDPKYYPPTAADKPATAPDGLPADATPMQIALTPLMRRARLRVTTRPNNQWGDEDAQRAWLHTVDERGGAAEHWAAKIDLLSSTYKGAVSSTVAREAAKARNWPRLGAQVGPAVLSWIKTQQLYGES